MVVEIRIRLQNLLDVRWSLVCQMLEYVFAGTSPKLAGFKMVQIRIKCLCGGTAKRSVVELDRKTVSSKAILIVLDCVFGGTAAESVGFEMFPSLLDTFWWWDSQKIHCRTKIARKQDQV